MIFQHASLHTAIVALLVCACAAETQQPACRHQVMHTDVVASSTVRPLVPVDPASSAASDP